MVFVASILGVGTATKPPQRADGHPLLTRRASEGRGLRPAPPVQAVPSLARRVSMVSIRQNQYVLSGIGVSSAADSLFSANRESLLTNAG
jgi:hypothetical protein